MEELWEEKEGKTFENYLIMPFLHYQQEHFLLDTIQQVYNYITLEGVEPLVQSLKAMKEAITLDTIQQEYNDITLEGGHEG